MHARRLDVAGDGDAAVVACSGCALISACKKGKNPERALEMFASIEHQRVQPNVITFSSLISAFEKGKNSKQALEVFASMEQQHAQPYIITHNSLISVVYFLEEWI